MNPRSSAVVFDTDKIAEAVEKIAQTVSSDISYPEIPEELFEVFAYLPELFQDGDEERYIEALSWLCRPATKMACINLHTCSIICSL